MKHIVGIRAEIWERGDIRLAPFDVKDDELWAVNGKLSNVPGTALLLRPSTYLPLSCMEYVATETIVKLKFRILGTDGYLRDTWGMLDQLASEIGLEETFGHNVDEILRDIMRSYKGRLYSNEITILTLWDVYEYYREADTEHEWEYLGAFDMSNVVMPKKDEATSG